MHRRLQCRSLATSLLPPFSGPQCAVAPRGIVRCTFIISERGCVANSRDPRYSFPMTAASPSPGSADAFQRASQLHRVGKLDEAERLYRAVLETDADHFDALHALGIVAAQRRNFSAADELLRRALAVDPRAPDALANRSNVQNALGRFADALASADEALRIDPRHVGALYNRALALHRQNRHAEAIASYDAALAVAPDFVDALANRGAALLDLQRYDEALSSFDRALARRPAH